jgi:hypothetical protein
VEGKMKNSEQSGSGSRADGLVLLAGMVGASAGGALSLLVLSLVDLHRFPLGLIVFLAGIVLGIVLGQLAGSLLFRRPPGSAAKL